MPRAGYYPDPSIPGYIRYWNGSSWVPGTSRPEPREGEPMPAPPPVASSPAAAPAPPATGGQEGPAGPPSPPPFDGGRDRPGLPGRGRRRWWARSAAAGPRPGARGVRRVARTGPGPAAVRPGTVRSAAGRLRTARCRPPGRLGR
ncbi:DUF2510 domain-containing protein [Streptomyces sp. GKU 257-1]|nr:DUF2510 domain-containing protein [Streptomyces sp. GKU 257-1]